MRVLLVEPEYRKGIPQKGRNDESLWYPPLGLLKLARFHRDRDDHVKFVIGCDKETETNLYTEVKPWDRVYISTLFTFNFDAVVKTINFYKNIVGNTFSKIYVGGIMASLMAEDIQSETNISPETKILSSSKMIGLTSKDGKDVNIDELTPDYSVLEKTPYYAVNDTYYGYTSRGCKNACSWCGVPKIEPKYVPYIDIKPMIMSARQEFGDKYTLRLMDNNVLASDKLEQIVNDLLVLGYGRGEKTKADRPRERVVDFNQGLDATFLTEKNMRLLKKLNIRPMRIAFDRLAEKKVYEKALKIARVAGVTEFSNYMLYNWKDSPRDLYERLVSNMELNEKWSKKRGGAVIYSYPMRYAPITDIDGSKANRKRDYVAPIPDKPYDLRRDAVWTKRFIRNIEIIKGAAHGSISPTIGLARRAIGYKYDEYIANLYMPEELLRYRNKYEKKVYDDEPKRDPGTGDIEAFRGFILKNISRKKPSNEFFEFHKAISANSKVVIKSYLNACKNKEYIKWLKFYAK